MMNQTQTHVRASRTPLPNSINIWGRLIELTERMASLRSYRRPFGYWRGHTTCSNTKQKTYLLCSIASDLSLLGSILCHHMAGGKSSAPCSSSPIHRHWKIRSLLQVRSTLLFLVCSVVVVQTQCRCSASEVG